jgi:hypothetical protein
VRQVIYPVPENGHFDVDPEYRPAMFSTWSAHLQSRLHPTHTTAPCVLFSAGSPAGSYGTGSSQNAKFNRLYGATERDDGRSVEETIDTTEYGVTSMREVFASYIFRTMHTLLSQLSNLKHLGAGPVLQHHHRNYEEDKVVIANYGLAFATTIILKRLPTSASSVRIRSSALEYEDSSNVMRSLHEVSWFNIGHVASQLRDHAGRLRSLDLNICYYKVDPFNSSSPTGCFECGVLHPCAK